MASLKISRPVVYTLVLGLTAYAVMLATEPEAPKKSAAKPKPKVSVTAKSTLYNEDDFKAKFGPVAETRNVFRPLVMKATSDIDGNTMAPNAIPSSLTGGDPNWVYTGTVELDGVRQALLENTVSGEGVYLRRGERWKQLTLASIGEQTAQVVGDNGIARDLMLGAAQAKINNAMAANDGTAPVTLPAPALRGAIGANPTGTGPSIANDISIRPTPSVNPSQNGAAAAANLGRNQIEN